MPCPWYRYGMCTSPKLPEPTGDVVAVDRCNSDDLYANCIYFVQEASARPTQFKRAIVRREKTKVYAPIHALPPQLECQCPECEISSTENGIRVAYCKILDRYLTKYEAYECSRYWKDCPYRYLQAPS